MSFFKDFKADFTQAMNELMPDGNEMYNEDEIIDEVVDEEVVETSKKPKKTKKAKRAKKAKTIKEKNALLTTKTKEEKDEAKSLLERKENEVSAESSTSGEDMDIAPEDMSEQIDELLDRELYSDEIEPQMLLNDDMEVDTMDMSVEELLNQLAMKQSEQAEVERKEDTPEDKELEDVTKEYHDTASSYVAEADMGLEAILNTFAKGEALASDNAVKDIFEPTDESIEVSDEKIAEPIEEPVEEFIEETVESMKESVELLDQLVDESAQETTEKEAVSYTEKTVDETDQPVDIETVEPIDEYIEEIDELEEESAEEKATAYSMVAEVESFSAVQADTISKEVALDEIPGQFEQELSREDKIENVKEEETMSQEKDVISINSVEDTKEEKATKAVDELMLNVDNADVETTYITKGTQIKGDLETEGSIDIIGAIEGSVICKGKVVVGGNVIGNITAGELYANGARIEGSVKSYGSVKIGVGTMIIGDIEGESAVIAGAVNGDIDVHGPVIVDSTAVVMGNIKSRSVQINNGAVIEGFCSQSYSDIDVKSFFE